MSVSSSWRQWCQQILSRDQRLQRARRNRSQTIQSGRQQPSAEVMEQRTLLTASVFAVTTKDDSGPGSFRQAILDANADFGPNEIDFNIDGTGVQTISPTTPLPKITGTVLIDGYSQPGSSPNTAVDGDNAVLQIELDGSQLANTNNTAVGLDVEADNTVVRGLAINRFGSIGIEITNAASVQVSGNFIGTDASGSMAEANYLGIYEAANTHNTTIGTNSDGIDDLAERNLVSGNQHTGIFSASWGSLVDNANLVIAGNLVGTNAAGNGAIPNYYGIGVYTAIGAHIGGTAANAGNLVSGNNALGILLESSDGVIQGNKVGTTADGLHALGNSYGGIGDNGARVLIGGTSPAERNLVSGNPGGGIYIGGPDAVIQGNYVGTDITGTTAIGNGNWGIQDYFQSGMHVGGTADGAGNLISGNIGTGIKLLFSSNTVVQGNKIGTDVSGMSPLGNHDYGGIIDYAGSGNLIGGTTPESRNLISGNFGNPIFLVGSNYETVQGNWMGVDITGEHLLANVSPYDGGVWDGVTIAFGSGHNLIGGSEPGAGNLIAGHRYNISIEGAGSSFNTIQGNTIGVGVGNQVLGGEAGVVMNGAGDNLVGTNGDGINDSTEGNVIAGLAGSAVFFNQSDRNVVAGNRIGITAAGTVLAGSNPIVVTDSSNNRIGGIRPFEGNLIAVDQVWSGLQGAVSIVSGTENSMRGNEFLSVSGPAPIVLGYWQRTPNDPGDADAGANNEQNFPGILTEVTGSTTRAIGSLQSQPNTAYTIDLYASSAIGVGGVGRHNRYLGSTTVTTDVHGEASFDVTLNVATAGNETVTATATDPDGNTSEFSGRMPTAASLGGFTVNEGGTVVLTGAAGSDPGGSALIYAWDLNGNGIFGETGAPASRGDETVQSPTFSAVGLDGPGTFQIAVRVVNSDGLASQPQTASITIQNVAPTITSITGPAPLADNQTGTIFVSATDPVGAMDSLTYSFDLNNDGIYDITNTTGQAPVSYPHVGTYTVGIKVVDGDGGVATRTTAVTVQPRVGMFLSRVAPKNANPLALTENSDVIGLGVVLSEASPVDVTIPLLFSGTATPNSDYVLYDLSGAQRVIGSGSFSVTIPAGETSTYFRLQTVLDFAVEGNESIVITLGSSNRALPNSPGLANSIPGNHFLYSNSVTGLILANGIPTVQLSSYSASQPEANGSFSVTASLSQAVDHPITIPLTYSGLSSQSLKDNATRGVDYTGPATLTIPAFQTSASASITTIADSIAEHSEGFVVSLGNPAPLANGSASAQLGLNTKFTGTILDDDHPSVTFVKGVKYSAQTGYSVSEQFGTYTITAQLSVASVDDVIIPLNYSGTATSGTDYTAATSLKILVGTLSVTAGIAIKNDSAVEEDESIVVSMGTITNAVSGSDLRLTIVDNDLPTVSIAASKPTISESGGSAGSSILTVSLSAKTNHDVTVPVSYTKSSKNGPGYTLSSGATSVTIPKGTISKTITLTAVNDSLVNGDQIVTATLGTPLNSAATLNSVKKTATVTIQDDDLPTVSFTSSGSSHPESYGTVTVGLSLPANAFKDVTIPITISGTAKSGSDYTISSTSVTIKAGSKSATISISIINDSIVEPSETVVLTIGKVTNAVIGSQKTCTLTITDDDHAPSATPAVPGNLALDLSAAQIYNLPPLTLDPQLAGFASVGSTPIGVGVVGISFGGQISGGTVFFDANKDGALDYLDLNRDGLQEVDEPTEVSAVTGADGYFSLTIPAVFDLNGDGVVDASEGQFVGVGGLDSFTHQPVIAPMTAPTGSYVISAFTTLMSNLMEEQGLSFEESQLTVQRVFNLPDVDLTTFDPIAQASAGNLAAIPVINALAKLEDSIAQAGAFVASAPDAPSAGLVTSLVLSNLAAAIADPEATLDLSDPDFVGAVIDSVVARTGLEFTPETVAAAASVIAAGNQYLDAIPVAAEMSYLTSVARGQTVASGPVAQQLQGLGAGSLNPAMVVEQNTGAALDMLIDSSAVGDVVIPGLAISDLTSIETDSGRKVYQFAVAPLLSSQSTIRVDFATTDNSATVADGDYLPTTGSLFWAAGDTTPRTIEVLVNGDTQFESDETFYVVLSNPVNAVLRKDLGRGTIINDDALIYTAPSDDGANQLELSLDGSDLQLSRNGVVAVSATLSTSTSISIVGADGVANLLTVNVTDSSILAGGLLFEGGNTSADQLIVHDESASAVEQFPGLSWAGDLSIDGAQIAWTGIESVVDGRTAVLTGIPTSAILEGTPVVLLAMLPDTTDPSGITYQWTATHDGVPFASGSDPTLGFVPADGQYEVTMSLTDVLGRTATTYASFAVSIIHTQSTTTSLIESDSATTYGSAVTFSATVTPKFSGVPTGTVTFYLFDSNNQILSDLGTATLDDSGTASLLTSVLSAGSYNIAAAFSPNDSRFFASPLSGSVALTVNRKSLIATITADGKTYNGTTTAVDHISLGGGIVGIDVVSVVNGVATFASKDAGTWTVTDSGITLAGAASGNYSVNSMATATAKIVGIGVLLLDPTGKGALTDSGNGSVVVGSPGVIAVASTSSAAVTLSGNGNVTAAELDLVNATGTQVSGKGRIQATIDHATSAQRIADPLASMAIPVASSSPFVAVNYSGNTAITLQPGTYAGGIHISGNGNVTLAPGIYYLKGGGLSISGNGSVTGNGVMIYNAPQCTSDTVKLSGKGSLILTAPTSGPYQGIALFQDRASTAPISISANGGMNLTGLLYAAGAMVSLSGNGPLAIATANDGLICADLKLTGNASLTVNTTSTGNGSTQKLSTVDGAVDANNSVPLIGSNGGLAVGMLTVAVDGLSGNSAADDAARIEDAIATIDAELAPYGVSLVEVFGDLANSATIHIHLADTSAIGGVAEGVLGVTVGGNDITLIAGWNWYAGADPNAILAGQYDFQTAVTHELGHALGLGHSRDTGSVMYPTLAPTDTRHDLTADDLTVIEHVVNSQPEPLLAAAANHREQQTAKTASAPAAGIGFPMPGSGIRQIGPVASDLAVFAPVGGRQTSGRPANRVSAPLDSLRRFPGSNGAFSSQLAPGSSRSPAASQSLSLLPKVASELALQYQDLGGELSLSNEAMNADSESRVPGSSKTTKGHRALHGETSVIDVRNIAATDELDELFEDWSSDPLQLLLNATK